MITRFAPSPTGPLHLGHAYSAMLAHDMARAAGGTFLLRIEDIDQGRARPEWEAQLQDDLAWLGLNWPQPMMRQSERLPIYQKTLDDLWSRGLLFPCTCTRRDIEDALSAPQEGVSRATGPDGTVYPGTCRNKRHNLARRPHELVLRLAMNMALDSIGDTAFIETGQGPGGETGHIRISRDEMLHSVGDIVLARKDMGTSYHLSVVLDDAAQGVTHVTRGEDLFEATKIHVVLQRLLDLPTPTYHHHRLIRDDNGKRLAKRDDARAIRLYRQEGATPEDIRRMVGLPA